MKLIVRPSLTWRFRFGDLITENAKAISLIAGANAPAKPLFYGGCAREILGSAGFSVPVRQPAYSCHPIVWRRLSDGISQSNRDLQMNRYMPLTGIDLIPASLLIDTQAPLDVLQAMADYRIRTVTQVLENIAYRAEIGCDTVVLSDFSKLLVIPLRDGCDLMDVIGRRLRAQAEG